MDSSQASKRDFDPPSLSIIGEDLTIAGNVKSEGKINLDGRVNGDIHCLALSLGENAELTGNAVADDVQVRGRLIGSVRARRVTLQFGSHVEASLFHTHLTIEQGSHFDGESHPSRDPLSSSQDASSTESRAGDVPKSSNQNDVRRGFIGFLPTIPRSSMNVFVREE